MSHLRLVTTNERSRPGPVVQHPRLIRTFYYERTEPDTKPEDWARIGRAASDVGAIRAAVVRIITGQYRSADIYGEDGIRKYRIRKGRTTVHILGFFGANL